MATAPKDVSRSRDSVCSVRARPWLARQLEEPRVVIFWRPAPDDGRAGLVCVADVCDNPGCACDDVRLTVYRVTERLHHVELAGEREVRLCYEDGAPDEGAPSEVIVETGTGRVLKGKRGRDPELLELMRRNVDAEVWAVLAREAARVKGRPPPLPPAPEPLDDREPGPLAFGEVFPEEPEDVYSAGGKDYVAIELYCAEPGCECTEVVIVFVDEDDEELGSVAIELSGDAPFLDPARPGARRRLQELCAAYRARRPDAVLAARHARMRPSVARLKARHDARQPAGSPPAGAPVGKPGRNDPCPCGSGRKHKKCCLEKAQGAP